MAIPSIRFCRTLVSSSNSFRPFSSPDSPHSRSRSTFVECSHRSMEESTVIEPQSPENCRTRWKPLCLYHTQGKCTKIRDPLHLEKFSHSCAVDLAESVSGSRNVSEQEFDYLLVLDLEGKLEILEFPVLLFDTKALQVVDVFHRFVRPTRMSERRTAEYIEGKYGKFGVDRVWHDTAIHFSDVIEQFECWLRKERHGGGQIVLLGEDGDQRLNKAAFVTCGNWDLKTKIPQQCLVSGISLPPLFMEWINIKDIFLNFYNKRAPGMVSMMRELRIPPEGSHHLGIDDSKNIARILLRLLSDGARLQITARRASPRSAPTFLFLNRGRKRWLIPTKGGSFTSDIFPVGSHITR
ncbi:hypothetical protein M569_07399 [Genlisea aurea]|uniref:Uncharacterized protein n=1 Tax=Genlisea aurea TaxID=192259 RepID=S8CKZ9_9LAMI|nr:hypothetical protein M569_07399 [Genlisea aurea]